MTKLVVQHILVVPEHGFRSFRSLCGEIHRILTRIQGNAKPSITLCTNFSFADSLTLGWHPIFNAATEQAEKLRKITIDWTANPPAWLDNQEENSMLPNDNNLVHIEEEVNQSWAAEIKLHTNKSRGREDATKMEKILYNNQPQAQDEDKATTDPTNRFSEATGGHEQEGVTNKK